MSLRAGALSRWASQQVRRSLRAVALTQQRSVTQRHSLVHRSLVSANASLFAVALQQTSMSLSAEQQEELDVVCAIFDDAWTAANTITGNARLFVPVPYLDGAATLVIDLPRTYLVDPGVLPHVTIEGLDAGAANRLCSQLAKDGLAAGDAPAGPGLPTAYTDTKGAEAAKDTVETRQVLFEVVTRVRDALGASVVTSAETDFAAAEADEDAADATDELADWRVYEAKKEAATATAKHGRTRAAEEPAPEAGASVAAGKLYGKGAYIARLKGGENVSFREGGNSMTPRIKSRQLCTFAPVLTHEDVSEGDAVFCKVGGAYYTHLVTRKEMVRRGEAGAADEYRFQISNNHGHVNGWTTLDKVYGRVVAVAP